MKKLENNYLKIPIGNILHDNGFTKKKCKNPKMWTHFFDNLFPTGLKIPVGNKLQDDDGFTKKKCKNPKMRTHFFEQFISNWLKNASWK